MQYFKRFRFVKTLAILLALALLVALAPSLAAAQGALGSSTNPVQISTPAELNSIHSTEAQHGYYYELTADINLAGYQGANSTESGSSITGWDPIGDNTNGSNDFAGHFIGGGHKISGLIINDTGRVLAYAGLFGFIGAGASVTGVILENPSVASNSYDVEAGSLAGYNAGAISDCAANGASITGIQYCMGGLVGYNDGTWNGSITDCYATGSVTGDGVEGGLVGHNGSGDGDGYSASISDSYAAVNVNGGGPYGVSSDNGGLVGLNTCDVGYASITDCYATGSVSSSGAGDNGGLVGYNSGNYDGPVGSGGYGYAASITDAFATGSVTGDKATNNGGLVGLNSNDGSYAYITDSYCIKVAGQNVVGKDTGNNGWSGQPNNSDSNAETSAAMQQKSTFTSSATNSAPWDYTNTWAINEDYSYPYLLQVPPTPLPTVTASANPSNGGTVNGLATYAGTYNVGDQVTVEAVSNSVYNFVNWTSGGNTVSSAVYYTFTMPESSVNLTANFSSGGGATTTTPTVQTDAATLVTGSSATLNGDITSNGGANTTSYGYYYGINSSNLTSETMVTADNVDNAGAYSASITGLSPGTTYYFEAFVTNSNGTSYGTPLSFTTANSSGGGPSDDTLKSLSLKYGTTPILTAPLTYVASEVYGTTSDTVTAVANSVTAQVYINGTFGAVQAIPLSVGNNSVAIKVYAQDGANQTYSLAIDRASNVSSGGGGGGGAISYKPSVQTEAATSVTTDSAVLNGDITSDNGHNITDYGFLWGTSASSLTSKLAAGADNHSGAFTATLSSLTTGTTYYFKAYATNSYGTADGSVLSFTAGAAQTTSTTSTTTSTGTVFSDVPASYWGYNVITSLSTRGIVAGYPDGTFKPDAAITRAEFAVMLVKALGLSITGTTSAFTDVAQGSWLYGSVNAAAAAGLVFGYGGTSQFGPYTLITREQMAVMVAKALGTKAPATDGAELNAFNDRSQVSSWATTGVDEAVKAGIVIGMTADTLAPQAHATRAQAAAIIYQLLTFLGK